MVQRYRAIVELYSQTERNTMSQTEFPPGWDEERVRKVLEHYEEQTEVEATAEDEAAFEDRRDTERSAARGLVADRQTSNTNLRFKQVHLMLRPE
jgi:hypothetical protein